MDFRGLLICYTRGSPEYYTVEKNSVAICLGSIHNLTGLNGKVIVNNLTGRLELLLFLPTLLVNNKEQC